MKTILIVDDDENIGLSLSVRLKAADYRVLIAKDGQEGLRLARINWPDLVLLDIGLPLMDIWMPLGVGYSVARRLKSMGRASMPFIFITASKKSGLREAAQEVGASGFFEKPYDAEELLGAIAKLLPSTPVKQGPEAPMETGSASPGGPPPG
jgi:CheY-like chemotaxis protein